MAAFNRPIALAIGPNGRLYVNDWGNRRVQVFERGADGTYPPSAFLTVAAGGNDIPNQLVDPRGIAVDDQGRLYIADREAYRVLVYEPVLA